MSGIRDVSGAIFIRDGKLFAAKRGVSKHAYVAHKYEFVGGKREDGETCEEALIRECREEMNVEIVIERPFMTLRYDYPDFSIYLHTFLAELCGEPERVEHEEFTWIAISDLKEDEWAPADAAVIRKIRLNYGDLTEKRVSGEDIFSGKIMNVKRDVVLLPDGKTATRELIRHKGAAGVLVVDDRENVYLCKQYRYPIGRATLEIPAGKRDTMTEDYEETAMRELREELGVIDAELSPLGKMLPAVGYSDEVIALFLAEQPTFGQQDLDEDEFLNVVVLPFKDALKMCMDGTIEDSKTLVALLKYKAMKNL